MTAYRFVRRDGWEKWIELDEPLPHVWNVPDAIELPARFTADVDVRAATYKVRMFVRQPWAIEPWPREQVYVEDDMRLDDADRFGTDVPSLHREQQYREALLSIERIIEDERVPRHFGPLGEAMAAMGAVERIGRALRRLPKWATQHKRPAEDT